jgi:hypothetical protein
LGPHQPARQRVGAEIKRRAALGEGPSRRRGTGVRIPSPPLFGDARAGPDVILLRGGDVLVRAVIANHNTSLFSELALRSLLRSHESDRDDIELETTVVDNHSSDARLPVLRALCADVGVAFETSRWPADDFTLNTHGDVLRDFVLADAGADHFLFVDADIDFEEEGSVSVLVDDIDADEQLWAVQARFRWSEGNTGKNSSLDIWAGRPIDLSRAIDRQMG